MDRATWGYTKHAHATQHARAESHTHLHLLVQLSLSAQRVLFPPAHKDTHSHPRHCHKQTAGAMFMAVFQDFLAIYHVLPCLFGSQHFFKCVTGAVCECHAPNLICPTFVVFVAWSCIQWWFWGTYMSHESRNDSECAKWRARSEAGCVQ